MISPTLITGLLTATISSVSILSLVYLRIYRICAKMKENGDWLNNPMNIPEYRLSVFLKVAIYVGGVAGLVSLVALFYTLNIQLSADFEVTTTLTTLIIFLIIIEIVAILVGIKYFAGKLS